MNAPQTDMTQEQVRARVAELSAFRHRAAGRWRRVVRHFAASRSAMLGLVIALLLVVAPCRALDHAAEPAT
jgi:peptide/nickel transport system permease protein